MRELADQSRIKRRDDYIKRRRLKQTLAITDPVASFTHRFTQRLSTSELYIIFMFHMYMCT